ncbi:flagellar protein [Azorhizobium oxalatiphilum]|uniref:Flagellar protein FliL n=1 Tax=Azorhizobium oxalatiphilum TaxID=980631 RepID=A0A917BNH1_9HYPH|nr:flagellar basal body-associated FliL family protein [Azorhizobium oxalatiphilum]GGF47733.1 flagellar protein [Azorhizobium oxalatiphilum]
MANAALEDNPPKRKALAGLVSAAAGGSAGRGSVALALLLLTVLAVATGGGLGIQLANTVERVVTQKAKDEPAPSTPLFYAGNTMMQSLKPVVVNLASPANTWVRVEAAFVFKNGALPNPALTESTLREDLMAYLRTLTLSQLEGPSALQQLREDMNERARVRSEGRVDELIVETLVVQ